MVMCHWTFTGGQEVVDHSQILWLMFLKKFCWEETGLSCWLWLIKFLAMRDCNHCIQSHLVLVLSDLFAGFCISYFHCAEWYHFCHNTRGISYLLATVMFAYEQCLLVLGHHPDIWYEAAQYLEQSSKLLAEKGVSRLTLVFFLPSLLQCGVLLIFPQIIKN